jgi:hypothetical protein
MPFAVGVLGLPATAAEADRRQARLDLSLLAYKLGYFVLDVVDVSPTSDHSAYAWAEALAERTDADAFVILGALDLARPRPVAERVRMVIRQQFADV